MLIPLLYATWQSPSSKQGISTAQLARQQASPNLVNRADVAVDEGASQAGAGWSATALAAEAEVCTCPLASRASQRMPSHANAATALASTRTALAITATVLAITASALAITCHRPRHHRRRALAVKILALLRCSR